MSGGTTWHNYNVIKCPARRSMQSETIGPSSLCSHRPDIVSGRTNCCDLCLFPLLGLLCLDVHGHGGHDRAPCHLAHQALPACIQCQICPRHTKARIVDMILLIGRPLFALHPANLFDDSRVRSKDVHGSWLMTPRELLQHQRPSQA
jgi:hypothetical protein